MTPPPASVELVPSSTLACGTVERVAAVSGSASWAADLSSLTRPRIAVMVLATVVTALWLTGGRPENPAAVVALLVGTALVAKGYVQASDIEPVIGALLTIGSVVWSVADKRGR